MSSAELKFEMVVEETWNDEETRFSSWEYRTEGFVARKKLGRVSDRVSIAVEQRRDSRLKPVSRVETSSTIVLHTIVLATERFTAAG